MNGFFNYIRILVLFLH